MLNESRRGITPKSESQPIGSHVRGEARQIASRNHRRVARQATGSQPIGSPNNRVAADRIAIGTHASGSHVRGETRRIASQNHRRVAHRKHRRPTGQG